jgi:hypothetical protein
VTSAGAWATGNDLNTARRASAAAGNGTQALCISGDDDPPVIANVEQWNGGSWTEIADVSNARQGRAGVGTYTAALAVAGANPTTAVVESWNGSLLGQKLEM